MRFKLVLFDSWYSNGYLAMSRDNQHTDETPVDRDTVLSLNFVPQWARRPPDAIRIKRFDDDRGRGRDHMPQPKGGGRRNRAQTGPGGGGSASASYKREAKGKRATPTAGGKLTAKGGHSSPSSGALPNQMPTSSPAARSARPGGRASVPTRSSARPGDERLEVQFLPEKKAIGELVKRIKGSKKAYPLLDLASLLLAREGLCFVRIEVKAEARDTCMLYQCKLCHTIALDEESLQQHIVNDHVDAYFDQETQEVDPPSGVFVCVAKCGISGALLGPPNHHRYAEAVKELHATQFAHMDMEAYRRRIEISHDPEDVEAWKAACSQRTVYLLKARAAEAEAAEEGSMTLLEAQRYMRQHIVPAKLKRVHRVGLPEAEAHRIRDARIRAAIRQTWQAESRFPIHLALALRAALRSRSLHVFRAGSGRGVHFVMPIRPTAIDPESAIPEIRDMLVYLHDHPGCTRKHILQDLLPGVGPEDARSKALLEPLHWLADKGHVIEFFNGTLSVPLLPSK